MAGTKANKKKTQEEILADNAKVQAERSKQISAKQNELRGYPAPALDKTGNPIMPITADEAAKVNEEANLSAEAAGINTPIVPDKPQTPEDIFARYMKEYTDYRTRSKEPINQAMAGLAPMADTLSKSTGVAPTGAGMLSGIIGSFAKGWNETEKSSAPSTKELMEMATILTKVEAPEVAASKAKLAQEKLADSQWNILNRQSWMRAAGLLTKMDTTKLLAQGNTPEQVQSILMNEMNKQKIDPAKVADVAAYIANEQYTSQGNASRISDETKRSALDAIGIAQGTNITKEIKYIVGDKQLTKDEAIATFKAANKGSDVGADNWLGTLKTIEVK